MIRLSHLARLLFAATLASALWSGAATAEPTHALAMHGEPALPADFSHFPYANPDAPKGGRLDHAWQGSFDSLNPFIVMGDGARGLFDQFFGLNVYDSLMARSRDEAFTLYPLVARSIEIDDERSFIQFNLDERARFSDGEPLTADDVIFTFDVLAAKGRPNFQNWIRLAERYEKIDEHTVRVTFKPDAGREAPLLFGLLPVLPEHATDAETFDRTTLEPMLGSGPYTVETVRPGEMVVMKRNPDYWARDIPSKRGFDNFDELRINYIRDENAMFEAFKAGQISLREETDTGRWSDAYDFPAVRDGRVIKETFDLGTPSGMYGFVLNTRRPVFQDRAVRHALVGLFDFEWANRNLFGGAYARTQSYYDGSELSSHGIAASDAERELLAAFPDAVLPPIMDGTYTLPASDGSGRDREFLRNGLEALQAAGYRLDGRRMVDEAGNPLTFEIMLNGPSGQPLAMAWMRTLERLGIEATIRIVDSAQYLQRQRTYDFDAMLMNYTSSLSPGAEQLARFGSATRDLDGTYNFAGVAEPAIDAMIDALLNARTKEQFITAVRAYDRVLMSGAYVVPLYYQPQRWVARWKAIERPEATPVYGPYYPAWWHAEVE